MRVVRVLAILEPGGAQLAIARLSRELRRRGVETRVLAGSATREGIELLEAAGVEVDAWTEQPPLPRSPPPRRDAGGAGARGPLLRPWPGDRPDGARARLPARAPSPRRLPGRTGAPASARGPAGPPDRVRRQAPRGEGPRPADRRRVPDASAAPDPDARRGSRDERAPRAGRATGPRGDSQVLGMALRRGAVAGPGLRLRPALAPRGLVADRGARDAPRRPRGGHRGRGPPAHAQPAPRRARATRGPRGARTGDRGRGQRTRAPGPATGAALRGLVHPAAGGHPVRARVPRAVVAARGAYRARSRSTAARGELTDQRPYFHAIAVPTAR